MRGTVVRVERRRDILLLRDARSGREIEVSLRQERRGGLDGNDLRRGDYVELSGDWTRGGIFSADRIESVRSGRR